MGELASDTAAGFGATVHLADARTLFLVVGADADPAPAVLAAGGAVLARLGPHRLLAHCQVTRGAALAGHADVRAAGPVSIDPARFAAFARRLRLDTD